MRPRADGFFGPRRIRSPDPARPPAPRGFPVALSTPFFAAMAADAPSPTGFSDRLRDDAEAVAAADQLAGMGEAAEPSIAALAAALDDARPKEVRIAAAKALGELGQHARSAFVALERASADDDGVVAEAARRALTAIGGGEYA